MNNATTPNTNACENWQHFSICLYRVKHGWTSCSAFDRRIDRDALLSIADAMDRDAEALGSGYGVVPDVLRSRAAEIREALGEVMSCAMHT